MAMTACEPSRGRAPALSTRFAPSPTGRLHLGHAYAAVAAHDRVAADGGLFWLRIEDIDGTRSRAEFVDAMLEDLAWLGLSWAGPVFQSARLATYAAALARLRAMGLLYPCFCTRADIAASLSAPHGPAGPIYPGTCRHLGDGERERRRAAGEPHSWRLDMTAAVARATHIPPRHGKGDRSPKASGGGDAGEAGVPYPPRASRRTVTLARAQRWNANVPEVLLWRALRDRPGGLKFRRQLPFGPYSIDFACLDVGLAIEIDGEVHARGDRPKRDGVRDQRLRAAGFDVLRIAAREVLSDLDAVVTGIVAACRGRQPLHHRPAAGGPPPRSGEEWDQLRPLSSLVEGEELPSFDRLAWHDERLGPRVADPLAHGDVILARKDAPASYHLAATLDDAAMGITHVVRGEDLVPATDIHRLLQALLDLPTPVYHHHPLLTDAAGRRLAKRDGAPTLASLRATGVNGEALAAELRALVSPPAEPISPS